MDYSPLVSLTHLRYYISYSDVFVCMQLLKTLDSPLQTLDLHFYFVDTFELNSTTFEVLPKWKESLQELNIYFESPPHSFYITGSPFKWFLQLQRLRLMINTLLPVDNFSPSVSWTYALNTFKGLTNLKEVHLNHLNIDTYVSVAAQSTFADYPLEVLDLSHNIIPIGFTTTTSKIGSIPTLKILDLSHNYDIRYSSVSLNLAYLCKNGPNLTTLDISETHWNIMAMDAQCSNLVSVNSSNSNINVFEIFMIYAPELKELYLSRITVENFPFPNWKIIKLFRTPKLKTLDLSSNQISVIDEEDAFMLMNITYLNLRNNLLTSLSNLNQFYNVAVLLVGGNEITTVTKSLISNNPLQILDLHDNVFVCECTIEWLREWLLTDYVVYLWNGFSVGNGYTCVEPQTFEGFSITEMDLNCDVPLLMYILVSVACGLVVIIAAYLCIRYRWHIQYKLFLLFNKRPYQNNIGEDNLDDDFEDEDGAPRYDAYVIYHNQDEDWVDEQLANIEDDHEEPFKLCLKNRDIRAGRLIFNELSLHIRRSRKSLVILTPRFVEDNWCYFQLNMAHHRVLEESHNVLIFIILEEIPDKKLTLLLRQLFCKSLCIKWPNDEYGQNLFWRRLREELKRPVPRNQINRYRLYNI